MSTSNANAGAGENNGNNKRRKVMKNIYRHTPQQVNELEAFFKKCSEPYSWQMISLSNKLGLTVQQVSYWFQNRRAKKKYELERRENLLLRDLNGQLRHVNGSTKETLNKQICTNCQIEHIDDLTRKNAYLKEQIKRLRSELGLDNDGVSSLSSPYNPPSWWIQTFKQ